MPVAGESLNVQSFFNKELLLLMGLKSRPELKEYREEPFFRCIAGFSIQ